MCLIKGGAMGWKKVPCGIWMSSKVRHCDGYYNEGWVYDSYSSRKGGHLSQQVRYWTELGVVLKLVLWSSIVRQWWQHNSSRGIKVPPVDQTYTLPSHSRMSDACRRKDMQIHSDLNMSDPLIKFPTCKAYGQHRNTIGVKCLSID